MKNIIKFSFANTQLAFRQSTITKIQQFQTKSQTQQIINFSHIKRPTLFQRIFGGKTHESLLQLYLDFIQKRQLAPKDLAYNFLQQKLRKKMIDLLTMQNLHVIQAKAKIIDIVLLQKTQFLGICINRHYNLNFDSYVVNQKRADSIVYDLKPSMRMDALKLYEKLIREFKMQGLQQLYGGNYGKVMKERVINRYVFEVMVDLQMVMMTAQQLTRKGNQGPTKHLLQVQSFFDPFTNIEQFFLTDFDYLLKGNPFFREKLLS